MLRLRRCFLSQLHFHPSTSPVSHLHRLLSATSPPVSPNPPICPNRGFIVEDYLVDTCGLTRPQALKASTKLSHLKSPAKPDAVLAFLAGLGLSRADVAAAVVKDPLLLCAGVGRTLVPVVVGLTDLGLSRAEVARLVSITPRFRISIVSKMHYYLSLFGSGDNLFLSLKKNTYLLTTDLEKVVKPNVVFLRECGLCDRAIAKLGIQVERMLTTNPERLQAMAACAEAIGLPRGSGMFRQALQAVAFLSKEKITARLDYLKETFRWSDAEVSIALTRAPRLLRKSEEMLRGRSEFLISEVGLEPVDIAHRPVIICLSLEGRLRPRHYVLKFLKQNGFLDRDRNFSSAVMKTKKYFVEKYICPHKEVAPHLAEDYAAACRGEVPTNFRFT
uniref:Uncharacterized protein n=1 Tax=Avena sativa TaxID=4498 RepID=A0ACD5V9F0_AVESA